MEVEPPRSPAINGTENTLGLLSLIIISFERKIEMQFLFETP